MLKLQTWVYNSEKGRDIATEVGAVDFDPSLPKSPEEAAASFHAALAAYAAASGYVAENVHLWSPEVSAKRGYGACWMVTWEEGPFEWAVFMSMNLSGAWGYTEPYHAFDLCFVE